MTLSLSEADERGELTTERTVGLSAGKSPAKISLFLYLSLLLGFVRINSCRPGGGISNRLWDFVSNVFHSIYVLETYRRPIIAQLLALLLQMSNP